MGCTRFPATVPKSEAGVGDQVLALNAFTPPEAVMLREGYLFACLIPASAFAACNACSLALTSGRLLRRAAGTPAENSAGTENPASSPFRGIACGASAMRMLNELGRASCRERMCK